MTQLVKILAVPVASGPAGKLACRRGGHISRRPLGRTDLDEMVRLLVGALAPGRPYRWEPRVHPYTVDGLQVDVCWDGEWVEVWECGLAHPEVLERAGLAGWSVLALGMGLDRLLMLRKGIPDIRLLRSADPRVAGQMTDLTAYRPVSAMPPVRRDLSVAVDADEGAEDLGDRVYAALHRGSAHQWAARSPAASLSSGRARVAAPTARSPGRAAVR